MIRGGCSNGLSTYVAAEEGFWEEEDGDVFGRCFLSEGLEEGESGFKSLLGVYLRHAHCQFRRHAAALSGQSPNHL